MGISTPGSGSGSSRVCWPGGHQWWKSEQEKHLIWLWEQVLVLPARWRVWTRPGCRPVSRCRYSVTPVRSECSRSEGSGPPFPLRRPGDRAGEETRRWPSQRPDDRCTAAPGAGWSCSTPVTNSRQNTPGVSCYLDPFLINFALMLEKQTFGLNRVLINKTVLICVHSVFFFYPINPIGQLWP